MKIRNLLAIAIGVVALTFSVVANAASWTTKSLGGFSSVHMYVPSTASPVGNGKSLLIVLHGCTQSNGAFKTANLEDAADEYGMVIAAPDAMNKAGFSCWSYWQGTKSRTAGDYKNVINLAKAIRDDASYGVDADQIYIAGLSSGGAFAMTVGCLAPDIFAGMGLDAAPSAGTSSNGAFSLESNASQTAQRCESYAGSYASYFDTQITNTAYGTSDYTVPQGYGPQNANAMATIYGVSKQSGTNTIQGNSGAKETLYTNGRVSMVEMSGVGHAWPGGSGASGSYIDGSSINYGKYLGEYFAQNNMRVDGTIDNGGDNGGDNSGDNGGDNGGDNSGDNGGNNDGDTTEECYSESAYGTVTDHYIADRLDINTYNAMGAEYGYIEKITLYNVNGTWTDSVDCLQDGGDGGNDNIDGGGQGGGVAQGTWTQSRIVGFSKVDVYVPPTESPVGAGRALMIVLHGCTQDISAFRTANLDLVADEYGMVIAVPDAQNKAGFSCWDYWGDSTAKSRSAGDYKNVIDLAVELRDDSSYGIDPNQVYVAGLSSGGAFAMTVGCLAPDVFAGMALDAAPSTGTSSNGAFSLESNSTQTAQRCEGYAGSNASYFDTQITSTAYGTGDYTVPQGYGLQNAEAMAKIYGVSKVAGTTDLGGATESRWSNGRISMVELSGVGHAWPGGSGASGSYIDSSSINYGMQVAKYFANNNMRIDEVVCDDLNNNGICDDQEQQCDDLNNNGICDDEEQQCDDLNNNGICDDQEQQCDDLNNNGICDDQEQQCDDLNNNGICDDEETCEDANGNGICDDQEVAECEEVTGKTTDLVGQGLVKKSGWYYYTTGDNQLVWSWMTYTLYQDAEGKGYKTQSACQQ